MLSGENYSAARLFPGRQACRYFGRQRTVVLLGGGGVGLILEVSVSSLYFCP